jgi:hypothetical protein
VGVSTHTAGYAEAQRCSTLPLSQRRLLHITSTPGPSLARGSVWAGGLVLTPSLVPHSWDTTSCREAAPSSPCSTDAQVDSAVLPSPTFTLVSGGARRQCRLPVELGSSSGFKLNRSEIEESNSVLPLGEACIEMRDSATSKSTLLRLFIRRRPARSRTPSRSVDGLAAHGARRRSRVGQLLRTPRAHALVTARHDEMVLGRVEAHHALILIIIGVRCGRRHDAAAQLSLHLLQPGRSV